MKKSVKWASLLVVLTLFTFFGCKSKDKENSSKSKEKPQTKVSGFVVSPSLLINEISVSGSILPNESVALMNEIAGRVVQLNLPEGKFVKKGTLLVKLYDDDLQANLKKMQTQLAIQEKTFKRQTELFKVNGISQYDYDQTYLQLNSIKADIEVQKSMIRKTEVIAPFDGTIGLRNISMGAYIASSSLLATIRMEDKLKLDFSIPEKYSGEIKAGLKVKFNVHGDDKQYDATVMATEGGVDANTRNLKVRAIINNKSNELAPGSFANVQLTLGENKNAILIPTQAIIPQERNKSVIVTKDGKAHFVIVRTGIRKASLIEISDGLHIGDTIVTTGLLFLKEGAKLSFSNVKTNSK
ncbi:MAG: efflux RND transporter periplasmic adaptor subunit [Bacteroidetes bacterium]|nr:efflux RND transporter periplasmic adaptor subunit [Bacteroidota bacterium]